jgi:hypothetical protein
MQRMIGVCLRRAGAAIVALAAVMDGAAMPGLPALAAERPAAPEKNPPGDIPDSQVFVTYSSPLGFSLKVPEGWARIDRHDGARFTDKYNAIDVGVSPASSAPTTASVTGHEARRLAAVGRAVQIRTVKQVALQSGPAILIDYVSNSEPNPVTNKASRLESNRYLIYRDGRLATLDLSAPLGADNADQWKLISNSFSWR